ncbi:hypothetical protein ACVWYF_001495 [Hymenobacter sp. UYAg731]
MKRFIGLALATVLVASGCKKDNPEADLPAATHTGANTAGCYINGQPFVATGYGSGLGKVQGIGGGFAYDSAYYLRLNGKFGNREGSLQIFLNSFPGSRNQKLLGTYPLNLTTPVLPAATSNQCKSYAVFLPNDSPQEVYATDASHTGEVKITYVDLSVAYKTVVAGSFEFTASSNLDPTKTLKVTSGRFDRQQ